MTQHFLQIKYSEKQSFYFHFLFAVITPAGHVTFFIRKNDAY